MTRSLVHFVNLLRSSGVKVSVSETLDCLRCLQYIDISDRAQFRSSLEATLIKTLEDRAAFDRLFPLYFEGHSLPQDLDPPPHLASLMRQVLEEAGAEDFPPAFRELAIGGLPLAALRASESGHGVGLEAMAFPLQASLCAGRIRQRLGMDQWPAALERLVGLLADRGASPSEQQAISDLLQTRIALLADAIKDQVEHRKRMRMPAMLERSLDEELLHKSFGSLSQREIEAMRQAVKELARHIKDEFSLRQKKGRGGKIDIKRTLRKAQRYGGLPMEIVSTERRRSKTRIVALCDVSSSVWNASRFMLNLLYSLQNEFSTVRSFVFVDRVGEVTEFFERYDVDVAVEKALTEAGIPYYHYTDYGSVFGEFVERFFDTVNRRTTVIVIGDGRTNFFYPSEELLERIRMRARRLVWLNPEPRGFWGTGDSAMHRYRRHCDDVRECRNLVQLAEFVRTLALSSTPSRTRAGFLGRPWSPRV